MHEPATTITDYLLALECLWFVVVLARDAAGSFLRRAFLALFAGVVVASVAGGTVHGFFPDDANAPARLLWLLTLWGIGVSAAAMLAIAGRLALPGVPSRALVAIVGVAWVSYGVVVARGSRDFRVAIIAYLPSALLLLAALALHGRRTRGAGAGAGFAGIVLALLGALGQQAGVALHPVHFDHNAVYHVVQAVALYLLFRCAMAIGAEV